MKLFNNIKTLAILLADARESNSKEIFFYAGASLSCTVFGDEYTVMCGDDKHVFTFDDMIETCEREYKRESNKFAKGHFNYDPNPKPMLEVKGLRSCFQDEIQFFVDELVGVVLSPTFDLDLKMAKIAESKAREEHIAACKKKIKEDEARELAKAGNAKLCGGAKVYSRDNHIGFGDELVHKSGKNKKINMAQKAKALQAAGRRVGFKAKENHNSKGAVRGGSDLTYKTAYEPSKRESHRSNTPVINPIK